MAAEGLADSPGAAAGGALAVDRDPFAAYVTAKLKSHPLISVSYEEVTELPSSGNWIVATGPLTSGNLAESIRAATGADALAFANAISVAVRAVENDVPARISSLLAEALKSQPTSAAV